MQATFQKYSVLYRRNSWGVCPPCSMSSYADGLRAVSQGEQPGRGGDAAAGGAAEQEHVRDSPDAAADVVRPSHRGRCDSRSTIRVKRGGGEKVSINTIIVAFRS